MIRNHEARGAEPSEDVGSKERSVGPHAPASGGVPRSPTTECQLSATGASHGDVVGSVAAVQSEYEVLTKQQVADWLKVRPRQLDRMGVPCLDWGHKTKRYVKGDVLAWIDAKRRSKIAA